MFTHYYRVLIESVPRNLEELITAEVFSRGASGVSEELSFRQMSRDYQPEILESDTITLQVFFETKPPSSLFSDLAEKFPQLTFRSFEEQNRDWMEEWKKEFQPFSLTSKYWVVPSWLQAPSEAVKSLYIDPGMAFGTGTHETTQLAAEGIQSFSGKNNVTSLSFLDVGTGTGILAMLAAREGFSSVVATEIEEEARRTARENLERNQLSQIVVPEGQIEDLQESFDFVMANIIDGVLLSLKKELLTKTKDGGYLLLTGILVEREKDFRQEFENEAAIELLQRWQKGEWVGLIYRRGSQK